MSDLLNAKQLAERLAMPLSTFHLHRQRGAFRRFETHHPIGIKKYSRALVDAYVQGDAPAPKLIRRRA